MTAAKPACSAIQADFWKSEVARDQELLDKTQLRSPIDGLVATPHIENMVGKRLQYGDSFAEIVDTSRAIVDVAIDDTDSAQLRAGEHASVKLNSFPTRIFRGDVMVVSPKGTLQGDSRVFFARVAVPNSDGAHSRRHGRTRQSARGMVSGRLRPVPQAVLVDLFTSLVVVWNMNVWSVTG